MSLSHLLAAVWFILVGLAWVGWLGVSLKFLGVWALITGLVWLLESYHPVPIFTRRP